MSIEKVYVCSTSHVRKETAELLDTIVNDGELVGPHPVLIAYPHNEFGWLIAVPGREMLNKE